MESNTYLLIYVKNRKPFIDGRLLERSIYDIANCKFPATLVCFESVTFTGATFWHCTIKTLNKFNGFKSSVESV